MQSIQLASILGICISFLISCTTNPNFSEVPELEYIGISDNTLTQNSLLTDSLFLFFNFTDGDGDIGVGENEQKTDVVLIDDRTGNVYSNFKTPLVPPQGASNGIRGEVQLKVFTTCCIFNELIPPCSSPEDFPTDTLSLSLYMLDRAGNRSNTIQSEQIIVFCD